MGEKGAKLSEGAEAAARYAEDELATLGAVSVRKMFCGFGVFSDDVMFAIVNPGGDLFYRIGQRSQEPDVTNGSVQHPRMHYWSVPGDVLADPDHMRSRGAEMLAVARQAKTKR